MLTATLNHPLVRKAEDSARNCFQGEYRTVGSQGQFVQRPFFDHLWEVANLLAEANLNPHVVASGLLHDHLDELDGWSLVRIEREFDPIIADILFWVETPAGHHLPWDQQMALYYSKLRDAPGTALSVVCATRISNIRSIQELPEEEIRRDSHTFCGWCALRATLAQTIGHYDVLANLFRRSVPKALFANFLAQIDALREVEAGSSKKQIRINPASTAHPDSSW